MVGQVRQEKDAAAQQEQDAQVKAASETAQATQLLKNTRQQAAHDETKAHKDAARVTVAASSTLCITSIIWLVV